MTAAQSGAGGPQSPVTADVAWTLRVDDDRIAWLTLDRPDASANSLSHAVMTELDRQLAELARETPKAVIVSSAKKSGFIAGADVKEFSALESEAQAYEMARVGQRALERLEALPCPTVAAIHGFALGGGFELALACRYRVAADDPRTALGLPEVKLGIHPGFGGTVRLTRLIGPLAAMELMLTGKTVRADRALALGIVDRLAPPEQLLEAARALALEAPRVRRAAFKARLPGSPLLRWFVAGRLEKEVAKRAPQAHYPAPYALIELWKKYGADPRTGYEPEARSIARMFRTPTSRNLVRVFLLEDRLKSLGHTPGQKPDPTRAFKAARVHVVGAGVMGGDIASWCAAHGLETSLQDRGMEYIEPALKRAQAFFDKRYPDVDARKATIARLRPDVEGAQVGNADVVIEAIFENEQAKRDLYARLEPAMQPDALLATNTSSIVLEHLQRDLADPGRLVGLHFFNPVARMPLVEVIHGEATRKDVLQAACAFTRQIDKLPLPCRSAPGFVVNRVLIPYLTEAMLAAQEGIPLALIDRAATDFGMPMGPIELADVVGLDVALHVGRILAEAFGKPAPGNIQEKVDAKKLGKKSGEGFYVWQDGKPQKPHVDVAAMPETLQDRLILPMLNEAVAVLRERIVADEDLLDAGVIFGTGFAPFRGGPIRYARERGPVAVVRRLEELARLHGAHLRPDPGWNALT